MLSCRERSYAPLRHIVVVAALAATFPAGLIPAPAAQVAGESGLTGVVREVSTSVVIDESRATHVAFFLPLTDGPE